MRSGPWFDEVRLGLAWRDGCKFFPRSWWSNGEMSVKWVICSLEVKSDSATWFKQSLYYCPGKWTCSEQNNCESQKSPHWEPVNAITYRNFIGRGAKEQFSWSWVWTESFITKSNESSVIEGSSELPDETMMFETKPPVGYLWRNPTSCPKKYSSSFSMVTWVLSYCHTQKVSPKLLGGWFGGLNK